MKCRNGGKVIPKNASKNKRFINGTWIYRCSCGQVANTLGMGWSGAKYGLIVESHEKGEW